MSTAPRSAAIVVGIVLLALLTGCGMLDAPGRAATPTVTPTPTPVEVEQTQFTRDGTFQSHISIDGVDFVYTLYPTKSTPRTNEWYPRGDKFFTLTFTAYDLDRDLRSSFASKRKVYLDRISVTSTTDVDEAQGTSEQPYTLTAEARRVTFDPEPQTKRGMGMLITSPKGSFELRNQKIGEMSLETRLVTLTISSTVYIQRSAGSSSYDRHRVEQEVPITIFGSEQETPFTEIPINAN